MDDDQIIERGGTQEDIESYAEANGATDPQAELRERLQKIEKAYVIMGEPLRGKFRVYDEDELVDLIREAQVGVLEKAREEFKDKAWTISRNMPSKEVVSLWADRMFDALIESVRGKE